MNTIQRILTLCLFCLGLAASLQAQSGSVSPGGVNIMTLRGNAENYFSMPYPNPSVATVRIGGVDSSSVDLSGDVSVLAGIPFSEEGLYYAEFTTGNLEGVRYDVVAFSSTTLFLDTQGVDLSSHPSGPIALDDQVRIIPHWTLADIFGGTDETIILEPTVFTFAIKDLVYLPNNNNVGINKTPQAFYYQRGVGWRALGNPITDQGTTKIYPGQGIVVSRRVIADTELVAYGNNRFFAFSVFVQGGDGNSGNDALLALQFHEPVLLDDSGLAELQANGDYVVRRSSDPFNIEDQLIIYEFGSEFPKVVFYWEGNGWYDTNANAVGATQVLEPGSAFYVRKGAGSSSTDWKFDSGN